MVIQKSSGSRRERWVKAMLPAAAIATLYVLLFNFMLNPNLQNLRTQLTNAQKNAVPQDAVATTFREKYVAEQQVAGLQERMSDAQAGIDESLGFFTRSIPAERMLQIDHMCHDLSIGLLNQQTTSNVEVSKVRAKSLATLEELAEADSIGYRQLDLVARYSDMAKFLRKLPQSVEGVVPLGIELLKEDNSGVLASGQRIWRVYLLM